MASQVKAVIFDVGGVLLMNRIEEILQKVAESLGIDAAGFREFQLGYHSRMQKGSMSVAEFAKIIGDKYGLGMAAEEIVKVWKRSYLDVMDVNEGAMGIVKKLKQSGYKTGLVSNVPDLHAQINRERDLFKPFDACILSCEVGLVKPEKKIFEMAADKLGLGPKECVYIDDRGKYLGVPRGMGFVVFQFRGSEQLAAELKGIGVL